MSNLDILYGVLEMMTGLLWYYSVIYQKCVSEVDTLKWIIDKY